MHGPDTPAPTDSDSCNNQKQALHRLLLGLMQSSSAFFPSPDLSQSSSAFLVRDFSQVPTLPTCSLFFVHYSIRDRLSAAGCIVAACFPNPRTNGRSSFLLPCSQALGSRCAGQVRTTWWKGQRLRTFMACLHPCVLLLRGRSLVA